MRLREMVVALRKRNLSTYDISRSLSREEEPISPAAVAEILRADDALTGVRRRPIL